MLLLFIRKYSAIFILLALNSCDDLGEFHLLINDKTTETHEYKEVENSSQTIQTEVWSKIINYLSDENIEYAGDQSVFVSESSSQSKAWRFFFRSKSKHEESMNPDEDIVYSHEAQLYSRQVPMIQSLLASIELQQNRFQYQMGKMEDIKNRLIKSFQQDPNKSYTTTVIVEYLIETKDLKAAENILNNISSHNEYSLKLSYLSALNSFHQRKISQAKKQLKDVVYRQQPLRHSIDSLLLMAKILYKDDSPKESNSFFDQALNLGGHNPEISILYARFLMKENNLDYAKKILEPLKDQHQKARHLLSQMHLKSVTTPIDSTLRKEDLSENIEKLSTAHRLNKANLLTVEKLSQLYFTKALQTKNPKDIKKAKHFNKIMSKIYRSQYRFKINLLRLKIISWFSSLRIQ